MVEEGRQGDAGPGRVVDGGGRIDGPDQPFRLGDLGGGDVGDFVEEKNVCASDLPR